MSNELLYQYSSNEFMNEFSCTNIWVRNDWWVCVPLSKGWTMSSCIDILSMKWVMSCFFYIFLSPKSKLRFWLCKGLHQCWQGLGLGINNLPVGYWFFWKWVDNLGRLVTSQVLNFQILITNLDVWNFIQLGYQS
jgi:hypothetical protein